MNLYRCIATFDIPPVDEGKDATSEWHLFNDFLVKRISEEEALSFPASWKVCLSAFKNLRGALDLFPPTDPCHSLLSARGCQ